MSKERDIYETGREPEFVVYDVAKWEDAGDGLIRVYVASRRGRFDKVEFSFVCAPARLAILARELMEITTEFQTTFAPGSDLRPLM